MLIKQLLRLNATLALLFLIQISIGKEPAGACFSYTDKCKVTTAPPPFPPLPSNPKNDPDLPNYVADQKEFPPDSIVIPMGSQQVCSSGSYNFPVYGLLVELLWDDIPLYWVIKSGTMS